MVERFSEYSGSFPAIPNDEGEFVRFSDYAALEAQLAGKVKVKPLEWHKSEIIGWNGDWHTVPTAYSIRCADENGWKWSGFGVFGYERSDEAAKAAAQADFERHILSALEATPPAPKVTEALRAPVLQPCHCDLMQGSCDCKSWPLTAAQEAGKP